jgi:hypothetical protein
MAFKDLKEGVESIFGEFEDEDEYEVMMSLVETSARREKNCADAALEREHRRPHVLMREAAYRNRNRDHVRILTRIRSRRYRQTHKRKTNKASISEREYQQRLAACRAWQKRNKESISIRRKRRRALGLSPKRTYTPEQYRVQLKRCVKWTKKNRARITEYERNRRKKKKKT